MAAMSDASFAVVQGPSRYRSGKGLASARSALGAMNTLFLARRGVEGPLPGDRRPQRHRQLAAHAEYASTGTSKVTRAFLESTIKKYNSMIHTQSAVHCMVELVRQNKLDPGKVVSIEANVIRIAYDFAGGGFLQRVDKVVRTKEQADHSLPYLLAVALLDGDVMPAQFEARPHHARRCAAAPQEGFSPAGSGIHRPISCEDACQDYRPATRTVRSSSTRVLRIFQELASRPFTWEESVEKFDGLLRPATPTKGRAARSKMPCILFRKHSSCGSDGFAWPCQRRYRRAALKRRDLPMSAIDAVDGSSTAR